MAVATSATLAAIPLALAWNFEPVYVVPLLSLTALYLALVGPLRARFWPEEIIQARQVVAFLIGMGFIALGVLSPINFIAMEYLFSAHMIQHVLFTVVGPPLLLLGTPGWLVAPLFRRPRAQRVGRWLTQPVVAFGLYNFNMWMWHAPAFLDAVPPDGVFVATRLLDAALVIAALMTLFLVGPTLTGMTLRWSRSDQIGQATGQASLQRGRLLGAGAVSLGMIGLLVVSGLTLLTSASWAVTSQPHNPLHTLMDGMFLVTALIYWTPILSPTPQLPRISPLFGMLYLFMSTQPMMALGALLVFSAAPLYHLYATAPRPFGVTAMFDQQLGGLIMWLIMDIPLLIGLSILFFRWVGQRERDEGQLTPEEELLWEQQQARFLAERTALSANQNGEVARNEAPMSYP